MQPARRGEARLVVFVDPFELLAGTSASLSRTRPPATNSTIASRRRFSRRSRSSGRRSSSSRRAKASRLWFCTSASTASASRRRLARRLRRAPPPAGLGGSQLGEGELRVAPAEHHRRGSPVVKAARSKLSGSAASPARPPRRGGGRGAPGRSGRRAGRALPRSQGPRRIAVDEQQDLIAALRLDGSRDLPGLELPHRLVEAPADVRCAEIQAPDPTARDGVFGVGVRGDEGIEVRVWREHQGAHPFRLLFRRGPVRGRAALVDPQVDVAQCRRRAVRGGPPGPRSARAPPRRSPGS